ncbi:hypothetical protein RvY_14826 [Ramazzottius varieornatus]|uniref:Uncharacterized protein n=1 Tax=Ramazzottius varieornatus TaxID=947166 RepID=A0A1D1W106_RAMVA|nr:hypothetical protein RvY_14826 [Ramazzottius varieornatus]
MEFFELITHFARADVTLQTAAMVLVFLLNRNQVYHLVFAMTALLKGMLPEKQLNRIRKTSCVFAFGWIGLWQCMHLIGYVAYIWDDLRCWEYLIRPTYFLSTGNNMPTYLDYLITGSSKLLDTNTELTAQCFYFRLVYWMGTGYQDTQQRLERALQIGDENAQMDMV